MNIKHRRVLIVLIIVVAFFGLRWFVDRSDRVAMSDIYKSYCNQGLFDTLEAYKYTLEVRDSSPSLTTKTWTYYHSDGGRVGGLEVVLERDVKGKLKFVSQKCLP